MYVYNDLKNVIVIQTECSIYVILRESYSKLLLRLYYPFKDIKLIKI